MSVHQLADWRLPGCGADCVPRRHDPATHERYGYVLALVRRPLLVVRTGPLVVDLVRREVRVHGEIAPIMNRSGLGRPEQRRWRMLEALAIRAGETVSNQTLAQEVLGVDYCSASELTVLNAIRWRLRQSLGDAARLVTVVPVFGMRLEMEPTL